MYSSLLRRVVGESVGPGIPQGQHDPSKRDRLLVVAEELFYAEGINTVGIDRVIDHAGVAKASLYDCFGSKGGLIRAYLTAQHERRQKMWRDRPTTFL